LPQSPGIGINYIFAFTSLRRNEPKFAFAYKSSLGGDFKPFDFSRFHEWLIDPKGLEALKDRKVGRPRKARKASKK